MKILLSALILFLLIQSGLYAHPHVRLYSKLEVEYSEDKCAGFWVEWQFDDYFSASVIHEFDKNKNGLFEDNEIKDIYNGAFINLKNYGYFLFLRKNKTRQHPKKVENFKAWQKDNLLFYSFYVPLQGMNYGDDFYIAVFDRSFYCDIKYSEIPVTIKQTSGKSPEFEIAKNKDYPVYYNPLGAASDMRIYKKWKPGLETAYPDEIRLFFKE